MGQAIPDGIPPIRAWVNHMSLFKNKYPKVLGSSIDPYKLSLTIKGILTAIIPVILVLAPMFNWSVNQSDFENLTKGVDGFFDALQAVIVAGTAVVSAAMVIWGVLRKILVGVGVIKGQE